MHADEHLSGTGLRDRALSNLEPAEVVQAIPRHLHDPVHAGVRLSLGKPRLPCRQSYRLNSLPKADLMAATLAVREPLPRYCLQRAAVEAPGGLWALGMACRSIWIECTLYCVVQRLVQYEQGQLSFCLASAATTFANGMCQVGIAPVCVLKECL